jgi:hypothetical protein
MLVTLAIIGDNEKAGYKTVKGYATVDEEGTNFFKEDENGPHEYVVKAHNDSYYSEMINNLIA